LLARAAAEEASRGSAESKSADLKRPAAKADLIGWSYGTAEAVPYKDLLFSKLWRSAGT